MSRPWFAQSQGQDDPLAWIKDIPIQRVEDAAVTDSGMSWGRQAQTETTRERNSETFQPAAKTACGIEPSTIVGGKKFSPVPDSLTGLHPDSTEGSAGNLNMSKIAPGAVANDLNKRPPMTQSSSAKEPSGPTLQDRNDEIMLQHRSPAAWEGAADAMPARSASDHSGGNMNAEAIFTSTTFGRG